MSAMKDDFESHFQIHASARGIRFDERSNRYEAAEPYTWGADGLAIKTTALWHGWQAAMLHVATKPYRNAEAQEVAAWEIRKDGSCWHTKNKKHAEEYAGLGAHVVALGYLHPAPPATDARVKELEAALEVAFRHIDQTTHCNDHRLVSVALAASKGEKT